MPDKLTSEELSDVMLQSIALSNLLLEKFEVMQKHKLLAYKAKQSLNTTVKFLSNYLDKVFYVKDSESEEGIHMMEGASHIQELTSRIEETLKVENLLSISDRKEILRSIVFSAPLLDVQREQLYQKIRDSEILNY